ncbi:MAG: PDZ domain-containing protein [Saprospiraceae bacterium]|nr:PDZ domain-containing protein [Saprospiraceae bacterium]
MRLLVALSLVYFITDSTQSQINAKLMRYLDVSGTQITFVYGGDIWLVPKSGGLATQLTHSPGEESWPRFSPDGQTIGYTASYHGNLDIYTIPVTGGIPERVTYGSHPDRMLDWHPSGDQILFASRREIGQRRARQFFAVDKSGGFPQKLPIPYGELASFSPDGNRLAYITKITESYPFKRYRGGLSSDILLYDLSNNTVENITNNHANDGKPAWVDHRVFFLSDQADDMRRNIWMFDTNDKTSRQLTTFNDFDITYMSTGPEDLVFENGGTLYLMNLSTLEYHPVEVQIVSDLTAEIGRPVDLSNDIQNVTPSPDGKRVVFEARGELLNAPVKDGYVVNLTQSSSAFDRDPSWSPDGKSIAFWSDRSGEYEIYLQDSRDHSTVRKLTSRQGGFGYRLYWSPDSKYLAFVDEKNDINLVEASTGTTSKVDNLIWHQTHPGKDNYPLAWSPDSKYLAYHLTQENANDAIFLHNVEENSRHQITSGYFDDYGPVFSPDGKYLFYRTDRNFDAAYSDLSDGTWIYPNATQIASISLMKSIPVLLPIKNDQIEIQENEKEEKSDEKEHGEQEKEGEKGDENIEEAVTQIDFNDIESRLRLLPPKAGNIGTLIPIEGKLVYVRIPNTGSDEQSASLILYDFEEREEKTIMEDIQGVAVVGNGSQLLVRSKGRYGIIKAAPGQKIEDAIPTDGLNMNLIPKEEWKQIFTDTWRRHRDFFYDANMHGIDWNALRERYGALVEDARTRWDVSNIQSDLASELSAGHTYTSGGDTEDFPRRSTGFLGIDWDQKDGKYLIKRIVRPASWDVEVRSPLDEPGIDVSAGDFILSVNGVDLDPSKDPYAAFDGLSGKTIGLEVSKTGNSDEKMILTVKCLTPSQENQLRHLEWIEDNRKMVDKLSTGQLGYVYMSNTGGRGQLELVSMYYGQLDKKGFIIDERFNGGGQLADRFLELMQRPVVYNLHWRHGRDHTYPIKTNTGPKGMLINGWAGSGGDGLPWAFQELKAGPIVGERTLGILVGPATGHRLIDGGRITVPGARLYDNDGHWFWEGEGVAPDIEVWDDPAILVQGRDPQIERVVEEVLKMLEQNPPSMTPAPLLEDRTAEGLKKSR